jgi:hypothetical protein
MFIASRSARVSNGGQVLTTAVVASPQLVLLTDDSR